MHTSSYCRLPQSITTPRGFKPLIIYLTKLYGKKVLTFSKTHVAKVLSRMTDGRRIFLP